MPQLQNLLENIADGLSQNGFAVVDGFLNREECEAIRRHHWLAGPIEELQRAGIGKENRQVIEDVRGDFIRWIDPEQTDPSITVYLNRLIELRHYLNENLFLSLKDQEVHIARYPAGAFYKRHLDQFRRDGHRRISVICYLNDGWQVEHGGQLRMYTDSGEEDILPIEGRLACFRSDLIEHEVLPATRERVSITGWLLDELRH